MEEIDTHKKIFELLFTAENNISYQDEFVKIKEIVVNQYVNEEGNLKRVPYEIIANYVFTTVEIPSEANELLYGNLQKLIEVGSSSEQLILTKFKDKIESHYKLCKEQKEYIQRNINSLNSEISKANVAINSAKEDISITVKETNEVNSDIINTKNKMYTEFVAILGIFSALMFGMISGFDTISDTLTLLASESITMGRVVIGSSALAIGLITLLYTLIQWIGHLINNPFRHQGFDKTNQETKARSEFEYRHSLYLLAIYMLLNIMFLGVILVIASNSGFISALYDGSFSFRLILFEKFFATFAILINVAIIIFIDHVLIGKRLFSN